MEEHGKENKEIDRPQWMVDIINFLIPMEIKEGFHEAGFENQNGNNLIDGRAIVLILEDKNGKRVQVMSGPAEICVKMMMDVIQSPKVAEIGLEIIRKNQLRELAREAGIPIFEGSIEETRDFVAKSGGEIQYMDNGITLVSIPTKNNKNH